MLFQKSFVWGFFFLFAGAPLLAEDLHSEFDHSHDEENVSPGVQPVASGKAAFMFLQKPRFELYGLSTEQQGFALNCPTELKNYSLSCLQQRGKELVILDAGHDDTPASTRSGGQTRPGGGSVQGRPKVHEGRINMLVSWLTYAYLDTCVAKSYGDRIALSNLVRFSRLPGEKKFGQYEYEIGHLEGPGGAINSGVDNRREWANFLIKDDPSPLGFTADLSSKSILLAVHSDNSGGVYNAVDRSWVIVPKNPVAQENAGPLARGLCKCERAG